MYINTTKWCNIIGTLSEAISENLPKKRRTTKPVAI